MLLATRIMKRIKQVHHIVLASAMLAALAGCEMGEEYVPEPFEDVEQGVVVLEGDELARELQTSPAREVPEPFVRLGLLFDAERPQALEIATSADGQAWSAWSAPAVHHTEVEGTSNFVGQIELPAGERARFYRLRATNPGVSFVRMELLAFRQSEHIESGEDGMAPRALTRPVGSVDVHLRGEWGARPANCSSSLGTVTRMAIHHTETPTNDSMSPPARLRQIQSYHMDVKGWCDIGYHYLVSRDGRVWEGRPDTQLGSHAGGANTGNIGISIMGSHDATPVTQAQVDVIAGLVRGLATAHGVPMDRTRIKGHREYKSTSCPGDALFAQLGAIVDAAKSGSGGGGGGTGSEGTGGSCDLATDAPWRCDGLAGTTTNAADTYYTTSFGCWVDAAGNPRGDAGDNCVPACSLASVGCSGLSGPACERMHNWYTAGADRFGCGSKVKVTNPDNGKSAVLIVLDRGPSCSIENLVDFWVLDMSYPASNYLFGGPTSATERADVQVEVVAASTPVGPFSGSAVCQGDPGGGGGTSAVTVMGVLYAGEDTANRIAGATVTLGGQTTTTSAVGAWQFTNVPVGSFTVSASKTGYMTRSITRTTDGAETWASFGLSPANAPTGTAILQGVIYYGTSSANRIPGAVVSLSTGQTITADGNGYYKLSNLPPGTVTITASAPGYTTASVTRTLANGVTEWGSVKLAP